MQTYAHAVKNDDRDAAEQAAAFLIDKAQHRQASTHLAVQDGINHPILLWVKRTERQPSPSVLYW
jgi:hypothetical protein